ncbi:MAG: DUF4167 domain-containing protein [Bdellovibrionales bacterium]
MRQGPNGRRSRNRHNGGGQHGQHNANNSGNTSNATMNAGNRPRSAASLRHQTFDSNCIEVRVRGNAWQVNEKYLALARDAQGSGDRISAENFLQHAEHYFRIIEAINEATALEQKQRPPSPPFNQQPDTPTGYYEGGQSVAATARGQGQEESAHTGASDEQAHQKSPSMSHGPQVDYRNQQIPSVLSDPFFGSEDREDGNQLLDRAIQR